MKTLITVIMTVFLTVSFAQPAHALSSGDRDKLIAGLGLAWLLSQAGNSHHDGEMIDLREDCRYTWGNKQRCNFRNSLAFRWEKAVDKFNLKQAAYLEHAAKVRQASAVLGELEVYAQKGLNSAQRQQKSKAQYTLNSSNSQKGLLKNDLKNITREMNGIMRDYRRNGGNVERLKEWANQQQDQFIEFDPTDDTPWENFN